MKRILTLGLVMMTAMTMLAQGWPAEYKGVMLQGFYWDSYSDTKWTKLEEQADELAQYFDLIWVPNSAYANATSNNMGYHPVYWFDHRSAFGTEAQLRSMISTFKGKGLGTIEDVVINHRASVNSNWLNFPKETYKGVDYQLTAADICKDDEAKNNGYTPTGAADTGEAWGGARDLDHTSQNVQTNVLAYEDKLLNDLGYVGFRYDFVKGFAARYVGLYNKGSQPQFSVGECWDGNKTVVTNWINGTKQDGVIQSAAFDFPLKYYLNDAFTQNKWSRLTGGCLSDDNTYKRYGVTFVDNHDTGRWGECPLYDNIEAANAFILMMPGTPCVWLSHWKDYKNTLKKLITIRKAVGIHNQSAIVSRSVSNGCQLVVQGTQGVAVLLLGGQTAQYTESPTEIILPNGQSIGTFKQAAAGTNYKVYVSESIDLSALDGIGDDPVFTVPPFCKVGDGETCAFFEIPSSYSNIKCWAWNDQCNFTTGNWPGATCTYLGNNNGNKVYKWTWNGKAYKPGTTAETTPTGQPTQIIFNNNDKQTADLTFVNGGYYVEQGTLRAVVGGATGIKALDHLTISPSAHSVYDLSGRRLPNGQWSNSQMKPGIYIVNGKKVVR